MGLCIYNSNEIGGPVDPNKIFKLGRDHNDHPIRLKGHTNF